MCRRKREVRKTLNTVDRHNADKRWKSEYPLDTDSYKDEDHAQETT